MDWCDETSPGGSQVSVTGNDDPTLTFCEQQKLPIFGSLEAEFKGVHSIMSVFAE